MVKGEWLHVSQFRAFSILESLTSCQSDRAPLFDQPSNSESHQLESALRSTSKVTRTLRGMRIKRLIRYACGHAEKEFFNRHCWCALIVGPVVGCRGRCGRVCGGKGEMKVEVEPAVKVEVAVEVKAEFEVEFEVGAGQCCEGWEDLRRR
jgi:hypothetical protein